ncbi:MAG: ABC transporter ATP-binding protein, partial [Deferribacteres bacterium]|nr:ABC transporter ATP-binding protein [Deferribacteres bacterium]
PRILLLDEPTAAVDVKAQREIISLLNRMHRKRNLTIFFVTHDINPVYSLIDRVVYMDNGQVLIGTPREMLTPQKLERIYNAEVHVTEMDGRLCVIVGDIHHG